MTTQTAKVEPMCVYGGGERFFVIRLANGKCFETAAWGKTGLATFETKEEAQSFIDRGEHIAVEILNLGAVLKAAGWDEALGYCEANSARLIAYCEAEGVHFYAADRENFSRYAAIRQAQTRGLSKLVLEDLS